ncbi:methyltransferase family protein [Rhabdaerophilum sp.]|uniref:methyltransferase family protein n=1 Tax=Rhabdaerophilum sp. TaxID=2717341 RepID=UPI0038D41B53
MPALDFARAALPTFFTLLALVYVTRMAGAEARAGFSLRASARPGTVQHVTHSLFRTLRLAVWGVTVIRVPFPQFDAQIGVFPVLMHPALVLSGLALLLVGFALCSYVHHYMAGDWRTGVEERAETNLITSGPFARLRHPMFLGVLISQIGFFLALPSVFSLICLVAGIVAVIAQARFEEKELARRFGAPYLAYLALTPGWLPRRGA